MPQMHVWFLEITQYFILNLYSQRLLVEAFDMEKKKNKKKPCLHVVIILFVYILCICLILHGQVLWLVQLNNIVFSTL